MPLFKATDILAGKIKMPETKNLPAQPEKDLGDALEDAGFTVLAGRPGIRRRIRSAAKLGHQVADEITEHLARNK